MRKFLHFFGVPLLVCVISTATAQVTLSTSPYTETFDNIGIDTLPTGFTLRTGASATALGTAVGYTRAATVWTNTNGRYSNYASGDIGSTSNSTQQAAATDRALGIRQASAFGNPGAAFVFQATKTTGFNSFTLDFKLQSLDAVSPQTTDWIIDYGFGASPTTFYTDAATTGTLRTGGAAFNNYAVHVDFGNKLDNKDTIITIRIWASAATQGSGNRATTAIDDFTLNFIAGSGTSTPALTVTPGSLAFPVTETNTSAVVQTYALTAANLTDDITITTAAPFTVSADGTTFGTAANVVKTDAALATAGGKTMYVKFTPTAAIAYNGAVTNASNGATSKVVGATGTGIGYINLATAPYTQTFDGIAGGLPGGITVKTAATTSALGTAATFSTAATSWSSTSGGFFNYASGDIGTSEPQATATDRALGVRQTGATGFDPGAAFVFQLANTTGKMNFTMDFTLQSLDASSPRTTLWQVDYGMGATPTTFTIPATTGTVTTGGSSFTGNTIHVDFGSALDDIAGVVTIRIAAITTSQGSGNRPTTGIDDLVINWEDPTAKTISLNTSALSFPQANIGSSSTQTFTIVKQTNLDNPVIVTVTVPYSVSTDNTTFSSSVSVPFADAFNKTIYVQFAPVTAGVYNSTVTTASTGATTKSITVSGEGVDPNSLSFNFNTCTVSDVPGAGWLSINTLGTQKWACNAYGRNSTNGVSVNGYVSSAQNNEAWLISPALHLNSIVNMPVLSFYSRGEYTGPVLQLLVSTDYDGVSSPATATWTDLSSVANFPTPPGTATTTWTFSDNIDLSAYKPASNVYIAFKYTSSPALNAARWNIDDVAITDQSTLLSINPTQINFGEVAAGAHSAGTAVTVRAVGSTDITISVPAGYELSTDNASFGAGPLVIDQATASAGTTIYVRFSPTTRKLKVTGNVTITGTGLNKNVVALTGSSYPKAETFDVACYNLAFFGANSSNNATPAKITAQINNIATVMQHLNADVIGVEEVSSDSALTVLMTKLPAGYAYTLSSRWSYSFNAPDPTFPPQKVGVVYNTATMTLSATEPPRALFEDMYDSARLGLSSRLSNYPSGSASSFWASGRLPYMVTFNASVGGEIKKVRLIVIHAKSSGDAASYNRRAYDARVLKDTLDAFYKNDNIVILGDYNDRLYGSIYSGAAVSPYNAFRTDANYKALTYSLDSAGKVSFVTGTGLIDHQIVSQSLGALFIDSSADIEDARTYISLYNDSTASDHLPVYSRFSFASASLPVTLLHFTAQPQESTVLTTWATAMEVNNQYFETERAADGKNYEAIGRVAGAGNSNQPRNYSFTDGNPLPGTSYYRLKQVDVDGKFTYSNIATVRMDSQRAIRLTLSPNPVSNYVRLNLNTSTVGTTYTMHVTGADGVMVLQTTGSVSRLSGQLNSSLARFTPGVYILSVNNAAEHYTIRFVKQ